MKQHFQTILLMAGSVLFPSCTLVNSLLFSSLLFSSLLFSSLLSISGCCLYLWLCDAERCWHVAPDQTKIPTHTHTHTHTHVATHHPKQRHTHTHRACSVSSNITSDTFGLLVVFSRHGYEHAAFLCVGGLFKKKKKKRRGW